MSDKPTITIPADLLPSPDTLRENAARLDDFAPATSRLLACLADEIERQAPRPVGWYFISHPDVGAYVYWWDGRTWRAGSHGTAVRMAVVGGSHIEPVTIGTES